MSRHPSVTYLHELHSSPPSEKLRRYLDSFNTTYYPLSYDVFKQGVLEFTGIANLNFNERVDFFGNQFFGIHYRNALYNLLGTMCSETSTDELSIIRDLNSMQPHGWNLEYDRGYSVLAYHGNDPASALDKLIQGPTFIDCGMFCQISIWFGIRRVLGNGAFNRLFGSKPFYITKIFYSPIDTSNPCFGNPLFNFFNQTILDEKTIDSSLSVACIVNHPLYNFKHPGNAYGRENCIINKKFIIFDPNLSSTELTKTEIEKLLCDTFNSPQNKLDIVEIDFFKNKDPNEIHPLFGLTYGTLVDLASKLSDITMIQSDFDFPLVGCLTFDFEKFRSCVQCQYLAPPSYSSLFLTSNRDQQATSSSNPPPPPSSPPPSFKFTPLHSLFEPLPNSTTDSPPPSYSSLSLTSKDQQAIPSSNPPPYSL